MTSLQRDQNHVPVVGGVYDDGSKTIAPLMVNASNGRLKVTAILATGGSGITSINGDTTAAQLITSGTAGSDVAISNAVAGTTTINIPTASATKRGALSSVDWSTFNSKGSGTVTAIGVTTANGVSGSSSGGATPNLTITLGAITPTSVNTVVLSGASTPTLAVTGTSSISGSNTGDQTAAQVLGFADPAFNAIVMFDTVDGSYQPINVGANLTYTHATHTLSASSSGGDITSVGDVASGAAFDGTQGTTLTFFNAGGNSTIVYGGSKQMTYTAAVADSGSNVAHILNNSTSLTTASRRIVNFDNNGTPEAWIDSFGQIFTGSNGSVGISGYNSGNFGVLDCFAGGPGSNGGLQIRNNGVAVWNNGNMWVVPAYKIGFDGSIGGFGPQTGDTYITKTLDSGGNWQFFYDNTEKLRFDGSNTTVYDPLKLANPGNTNYAIFDTSLIATSNKTFTFPNNSGTIALTSDITGNIAIYSTTGTTLSITTTAGQKVVAWAKGDIIQTGTANYNVSLKYNSVTKDVVQVGQEDTAAQGWYSAFSLMYTETPGAATHDITVTTSGGTLENVVIIAQVIG